MEPPHRVVELLGPGRWTPVAGGDICRAWRFERPNELPLFVKTHDSSPPGFFAGEAAGLELLRSSGAVLVPTVEAHSDEPGAAFLALDWIDAGAASPDTDETLGRSLAAMHTSWLDHFGGDGTPAHLGSIPIDSTRADTWAELWAELRLRPLARMGLDSGSLPSTLVRRVDSVAERAATLAGPIEPPARVHGDLWSGNVLIGRLGEPWLIDPSAHGGHRETDLAMMRLFGGFSDRTFAAYEEVAPLGAGWRERVALHQLVPLLVHVVLFGGSYVSRLEEALDRVA